ncbi:MAG TPA: hypothetical protein VN580_11160 [Clostridia bacterium]|nr:hypothetical protein [Clostridia bacterium]
MDKEIKAYLSIEMKVAAAFNFFINGMVTALIYRKADTVPTDTVSIAVDLILTCLFTFIVSSFFNKASLRRTKTDGILEAPNPVMGYLGRLFRRPVLFGALLGFSAAAVLFGLIAPVFALLGLKELPFGLYITLKTIFCALLGGGVTFIELYAGMCRAE